MATSGQQQQSLGRQHTLHQQPQHLRGYKRTMNLIHPSDERDYIPIADHALIGNLRTAALVSLDGSIESYCVPHFDSPSVFGRILDKDKGGHFSLTPMMPFTTKQNYLPSSNVLQTKFMNDAGVVSVTDFLPRPPLAYTSPSALPPPSPTTKKPLLQWLIRRVECVRGRLPMQMQCAPAFNYARDAHVTTLVEDDSVPITPEGAFGHSTATGGLDLEWGQHRRSSSPASTMSAASVGSEGEQPAPLAEEDDTLMDELPRVHKKALFESPVLNLDLRYIAHSESDSHEQDLPDIELELLDLSKKGHKGLGVQSEFCLEEGQGVTFIFRVVPEVGKGALGGKVTTGGLKEVVTELAGKEAGRADAILRRVMSKRPADDPWLTKELMTGLLHTTNRYWYDWVRQSTYTGSWKEAVLRSALALKLLIYEPTGAVVASPTFSLPEYVGGVRNWDYRYSWIRDSSFTLYALIRLGFTHEANAYLEFIFERIRDKNPDGSIQIMYTIHGGKTAEEIELDHLDGHKGSRPVRVGNGAADHVQLVSAMYDEVSCARGTFTANCKHSCVGMDCIYLGQKFGKPLSYDDWVLVREIVDYVVEHYNDPDLSIWEVRDMKRNFTYSKVMLWVAIDRGLRLADKRSLPCPNRYKWLEARDQLYEDIMSKAWNKEQRFFGQSYEETDIMDAAVLIMPLVFFMHGSDPRFVSTLKRIMKSPERGGLTSNNLVYRYDVKKSGDGVGGEEGTFCLCTLWCVEALTRAGKTDKALLLKAVSMFEDFLLYLNHVGLCTEEISDAGEALGNAVQGFTHVTLISAAYNLSRTMHGLNEPTA